MPLKRKKYCPYPLLLNEKPSNRIHCQSCGTDSSPEWRRGPTGHKT
jgi:hypothetical protein